MRDFWSKDTVINGWLSIASAFSAEVVARQGWDSVCIDAQHGMLDFNDTLAMIQAIGITNTPTLVRIPYSRPEIIGKYLDTGIQGVICPMVNSQSDAENLVKWSKYPPLGERSFGTCRAQFSYSDYFSIANTDIFCLAMIETRTAVSNVDAICRIGELDGLYIGPADLSCDYGYRPAFDRQEEEMVKVIRHIIDTAKKYNKKVGLHTSTSSYAKRAIGWGVDLVTVSSDLALLAKSAKGVVTDMRS